MAQLQFRSDDTITWSHGFGNGSTGSSYAVPANEGCSGTSGTKTLTLAAAGSFANNDLILIHQTRGTGEGGWQLNKIVSGAGSTTLTLKYNLTNTYTDSGASQAQVIELNQYEDLSTGSITSPTWDGSKGGIVAFLDKATCTVNGNIVTSSRGFKGGTGVAQTKGNTGEGTTGASISSLLANGNGGGGGEKETGGGNWDAAGGGGGGNGAAGTAGTGTGGAGGGARGNAALIDIVPGGGGGAGGGENAGGSAGGNGGRGTGMVFIFASTITITGAITNTGTAGANSNHGGGGGGAGGSVLLKAEVATLGTAKITASGGAGGTGGAYGYNGGAGGVGRIHLDYSESYTGTTSPAINVTEDSTIVPGGTATGNMFLVI